MIDKQVFLEKADKLITEEDKKKINGRKKGFKKAGIIILSVSGVVSIVGLFLGFFLIPLLMVSVMLSIIFFIISATAENDILSKYKPVLIGELIKSSGGVFDPTKYLGPDVYNQFQLRTNYDKYTGGDYIELPIPDDNGNPTQIKLKMSEVKTTRTYTDDEGKRHTETLFSGVLGIIDFDFKFPCYMALNMYHRFSVDTINMTTESTEFNKKFPIRTNNEMEAMRIITPDFMVKLLDLRKHLSSLGLVFKDDKLLIQMYYKDMFIVKKRKNQTSPFESLYNDVNSLLELIKEIQTNNKVFKM